MALTRFVCTNFDRHLVRAFRLYPRSQLHASNGCTDSYISVRFYRRTRPFQANVWEGMCNHNCMKLIVVCTISGRAFPQPPCKLSSGRLERSRWCQCHYTIRCIVTSTTSLQVGTFEMGGQWPASPSERGSVRSGFGAACSAPVSSQPRLGQRVRGLAMLRTEVVAMQSRIMRAVRADPDVVPYAAKVSVWVRWLFWLVGVVELAYRPGLWYAADKPYLFLIVPLVAFNGFVHYRLLTDRTVTWRWLLFLSAMDIALISAGVVIGGEFHLFIYVAYYPALALFAVVFTSLWLSLAWTTMAAVVYAVVSLTMGSGLDFDLGQEKALLARLAAMYGVVACVSLIARFERVRRQESMERERGLLRERIELSQAIHDTAAQTAYMIGLGIRRAMKLAGESNEELTATLAATSSLSKAVMWELRRPIDQGHIFEGRELGRVLWSHTETFGKVTAVPAEMSSPGSSRPSPWRPAPVSSPSLTTLSPTLSCTPRPAKSRSGWTSRLTASGCRSRTTG